MVGALRAEHAMHGLRAITELRDPVRVCSDVSHSRCPLHSRLWCHAHRRRVGVALHLLLPTVPVFAYDVLAYAPIAAGVRPALAVIGIDYAATAVRNAVCYHNVGAKYGAHCSLGGSAMRRCDKLRPPLREPHNAHFLSSRRATRLKVVVHDGFGVSLAFRHLSLGAFTGPGARAESELSKVIGIER